MIVLKFGGTSVQDSTAIRRAGEIVRSRLAEKPVVVVSALAGVTDQLLAMCETAGRGQKSEAITMARTLRERHFSIAGELLGVEGFGQFHPQLEADLAGLEELLGGIAAVGECTPRSLDRALACGEIVSSAIIAAVFSHWGLPAQHLDARECIVTDAGHTRAIPDLAATDERLKTALAPLLSQSRLPVMGGFIAATAVGVTTTLGRGGSDFSAAIVGAALDAGRIEIWTDVDGIMTTDPRLFSGARRIKAISFDEAAELAYFGAKVLHPATLLPAIQKNIPVCVLNSRNPQNPGTRITARAPVTRNVFKAIAIKRRITIVDLVAPRMLMAHGFLRAVFEVFDRHRCPVDMVSTSEVSLSLTVDSNQAIPAIAADLEKLADVKYTGRKAIICLVGENLRQRVGIAGQLFGCLADVNIRMISQGASEINISFVIDEQDVQAVVERLHQKFFSELDPEVFEA